MSLTRTGTITEQHAERQNSIRFGIYFPDRYRLHYGGGCQMVVVRPCQTSAQLFRISSVCSSPAGTPTTTHYSLRLISSLVLFRFASLLQNNHHHHTVVFTLVSPLQPQPFPTLDNRLTTAAHRLFQLRSLPSCRPADLVCLIL